MQGLNITEPYIVIRYPNGSYPDIWSEYEPGSQRYVELDIRNATGTMNVTLSMGIEHIPGSVRYFSHTIQVTKPSEEPASGESGFPWWQIMIVKPTK